VSDQDQRVLVGGLEGGEAIKQSKQFVVRGRR
jgi:hypothetical protein